MPEYDICPGTLKFKGNGCGAGRAVGRGVGGVVKKRKRKHSPTDAEGDTKKRKAKRNTPQPEAMTRQNAEQPAQTDGVAHLPAQEGGSNPSVSVHGPSRKTEAEKRFEEAQKRRLLERVQKLAKKTHKDRVNEFNAHLESLSEHHDIPKVGPG